MRPRLPRGLYAVTPDDGRDPVALAALALAGGAVAVQYRDKSADRARRRREARALAALCHANDAILIVNDDVELALASGAAGVHLGRDDAGCAATRARVGDALLIGVSCYASVDRAGSAVADGADYVAFGSAYHSPTKPGAAHAPLELYEDAARSLPIPVVAIGGITPANAAPLVAAGCHCVAVISGVFDAGDPRRAATEIATLFEVHGNP